MVYAIFPPYSSYQPDRGYYVSQPATIGEVNRVWAYVDAVRRAVNDLIANSQTHQDDLTDILNRLQSAEDGIKALQMQQDQDEETAAGIRKDLQAVSDRFDKLMEQGVVHGIEWASTSSGYTVTVLGSQGSATRTVGLKGDDSVNVLTQAGPDGTTWTLTTKGGTNDLKRLGLHSADGAIELTNQGQRQAVLPVMSSDKALTVTSDSGALDLTAGPLMQAEHDDLQAAKAKHEQDVSALQQTIRLLQGEGRLTAAATAIEDGQVVLHMQVTATDGHTVRDLAVPLPMEGDGTNIGVSADSNGWHLKAADQLMRLPVMLTGATIKPDAKGLVLETDAYDPKTGQALPTKQSSAINISADDTMNIIGTDQGLSFSAQPALLMAQKHADSLNSVTTQNLQALEARVQSLTETVTALQTRVANAEETARKSVTAATMSVDAVENDNRSVQLTLKLFNGQGSTVAVLPAELRITSPRATMASGIQVSEHTATISIDTKAAG